MLKFLSSRKIDDHKATQWRAEMAPKAGRGIRRALCCTALAGAWGLLCPLSAAPVISQVMNAASSIDGRMPNASLAPGSIFIVTGTGLGPASISVAPLPFQSTTLSGTSVKLTVKGTSVDASMYYTSATQIAALAPSNTPTGGPASITVTYNGQAGTAQFRGLVNNNLAIFTVDSTGTGPAIVTYPDYSLVSPFKAVNCGGPSTTCGAANPGDTLILWGTGLGAISGNDVSGDGLGQNMPNIPLTIWLGGVKAPILYQGRSGCCVGVDQIVFTVPNNVPTGCAVPLVAQINNQISNSTVIPVAVGNRACGDTTTGIDASQLNGASLVSFGNVELDHFRNDAGTGYVDQAQGFFLKLSGLPPVTQAFLLTYTSNQPIGTCKVIGSKGPGDIFFTNLVNNGYVSLLDGGSSFTVAGPKGSMNAPLTGNSSVLSASGAFLTPGDYTISGNGGKDIGPFTAHLTIPATPILTSPAPPASGLSVTRNQGMTVTWNPNGSTGHVEVILSSFVAQDIGAQAICTAPASAGTLTLPPYVLLSLPAGSGTNFWFQPGSQAPAVSVPFSASGLTVGTAQAFIDAVYFGGFQIN